MWWAQVPVVEPTPTTARIVPGCTTIGRVESRQAPFAVTVGAVERAVPWSVTLAPIAAFAKLAEAPEMVVAAPAVGSWLYCSVEAVASFAVMQTDCRATTATGAPVTLKSVRLFEITAGEVEQHFSAPSYS
jgi:hypothetical protein